mgnify:FL=1
MLDKTDYKIINILKQDASLSTHKITKRTLIPQTTVLNRIKKLKRLGIINKFTIDLNYKKLDQKAKALMFTKVNIGKEKEQFGKIGTIEKTLLKHPNVLNVKRLMGEWDFVLEIVCKDIDDLNQFLIKEVRSINSVIETKTVVVLEEWT